MNDSTTKKRVQRFSKGCCPVHGQFMGQIDRWYEQEEGGSYTIVGCSRNACLVTAKAYSVNGPWELSENYRQLLEPNSPDPVYLEENAEPQTRKKSLSNFRSAVWEKTNGYCNYCGEEISFESMTIDHLVPEHLGGIAELSNLFPSCKSCNSSKGAKQLEEFRFFQGMRVFQDINGVSFAKEQLEYLDGVGHAVEVPEYKFWFENIMA